MSGVSDTILAPTLITSAVALFTIATPIGTLPVFLQITEKLDPRAQRRTGLLVGVAVIVVLLVATIGWAMLLDRQSPVAGTDGSSPVVVPLAMPLVAGPGAIALAITFAHSYRSVLDYVGGAAIVVVVGALVSVIYYFGPSIHKLLGPSGMSVLTRVFGLLLLAIAVQSILLALGEAFPAWAPVPASS